MGLGKKFLWSVLYARQNTVSIRLISLSMAIAILVIKLYIWNKRAKSKIGQIITMIDNKIIVDYGKAVNKITNSSLSKNTRT